MPQNATMKQRPYVGPAELRQFGLKAMFVAMSLISVECAVVRLLGRIAVPLCVHFTATAAILAWTKGSTWRGAGIGFASGACLVGMLALPLLADSFRTFFLSLLTFGSFGSWIGAALQGMGKGYSLCALALLVALHWPIFAFTLLR